MIKITFECETHEDYELVRRSFAGIIIDEQQKKKRSEYDKQRYAEKKNSNVKTCENDVENVDSTLFHTKEERAEKEEDLPLSSPSSLSSSPSTPIINPITPYNPPLPEEKGEKEENVIAAGAAKRGPLAEYGEFVRLSEDEYQKLVDKFGTLKATMMIANMDHYIGEDPKRQKTYKTRNHYLTLLNWQRMDEERKKAREKPQTPVPKRKTFDDLAAEYNNQPRQEYDIDI